MPSRKLPQTDRMRYEAMKKALDMADSLPIEDRAFRKATYDELKAMFSRFEQIFLSMEKLRNNHEYMPLQEKTRQYITHYLQVMIMAVERSELPENTPSYYGLKPGSVGLPKLKSAKQVIEFGKTLFENDAKRISKGGKYITNPSIAVVKVWFEKFVSAYNNHQVQVKKYKNNKDFLEQMRREAHVCIKNTWDEIEASFEHLSPALKRKAAARYGVMYIESPREQAIRTAPSTGSLFKKDEIPEEEPEIRTVQSKRNTRKLNTVTKNTENQVSLSFVKEDQN